jgi:nucleotide-binding universal stress UspA family protein
MYDNILLAAALQRWDHYNAHALAARELALFIASNASKRLYVSSVYDYEYQRVGEISPEMAARIREDAMQRTDQLMKERLAGYIAPLKAEGLEVIELLQVGNPRELIVRVARDIEADLIIMGSHSKRGILDVSLGGTAQSVSRHAPCTVVLVSPKP